MPLTHAVSGFFHIHKLSATTPKFISKREMQESWRAIIKANHETIKSNHEILPKAIITTSFRVVGWGNGAAGMMVVVTTKPRTVGKNPRQSWAVILLVSPCGRGPLLNSSRP